MSSLLPLNQLLPLPNQTFLKFTILVASPNYLHVGLKSNLSVVKITLQYIFIVGQLKSISSYTRSVILVSFPIIRKNYKLSQPFPRWETCSPLPLCQWKTNKKIHKLCVCVTEKSIYCHEILIFDAVNNKSMKDSYLPYSFFFFFSLLEVFQMLWLNFIPLAQIWIFVVPQMK